MALQIEILTPTEVLLKGTAEEVVAPSISGEIGLLPQHTDYLTLLNKGHLIITQQGRTKDFHISGGLCTIAQDQVTILLDGIIEDK